MLIFLLELAWTSWEDREVKHFKRKLASVNQRRSNSSLLKKVKKFAKQSTARTLMAGALMKGAAKGLKKGFLAKMGDMLGIGVEVRALRLKKLNLQTQIMRTQRKVRMDSQDLSHKLSEIDTEANQLNENLGTFIISTKEQLSHLLALAKKAVYSMRPARIDMLKQLGQLG